MWKRRKEETPFERTPETAPRPATTAASLRPAPPPAVPAPRVTRTEGTIGKTVRIKGQLFSDEDIHLDGQIEGTLELPKNKLTIGKSGKVQATVKAREVDVHGTVQGDIQATEKITIRTVANLIGDLKSATISIEDGAYFKGSIDIVRAAPAKASPPPPPLRSQAAAAPGAGSASAKPAQPKPPRKN